MKQNKERQFFWYSKFIFLIGSLILTGIGAIIYILRNVLLKLITNIGIGIKIIFTFLWDKICFVIGTLNYTTWSIFIWIGCFFITNKAFNNNVTKIKYWKKHPIRLFFMELLLFVVSVFPASFVYSICYCIFNQDAIYNDTIGLILFCSMMCSLGWAWIMTVVLGDD